MDSAARIRQLEAENREQKKTNEILRAATAYFGKAEFDRLRKGSSPSSMNTRAGGVAPVCAVLTRELDIAIAPGTSYAFKARPLSARAKRDAELKEHIIAIHTDPRMRVYGIRKIHAQLGREGIDVARCTVERLCRELGIRGLVRGKFPRTTRPAPETSRPADLVKRDFTATAPDQLRVADLTYVRTESGWGYVAFVLDVFSRMIVCWQTSRRMYMALALDSLNTGLWVRKRAGHDVSGLRHHSDRGVQGRALRYTQTLEETCAVVSVGSRGDSFDNAMAEALNSLYKAEPIHLDGAWAGRDDVEVAAAGWVHWFNTERLHSMLDYNTPVEVEDAFYARHAV